MKIQFLGDARDAFKWEYQDHLVKCLGYPVLQIVPMLTADDGSNDGKTHPTQFPADPVFHNFCLQLRQSRSLEDLYDLPSLTDADYRVALHRQGISWPDIVADIRGHYPADQCAVIYGYSVMFVTISKSPSVIESVAEANAGYAATRRLTAS
jgi:hypothetical protein